MKWLDTLRSLRRSIDGYAPLIEVGLKRDNLLHNLHTYQEAYLGIGIAPVLKSNAYGHGLIEVASILDGEDIPFFMTDSWYEAQRLRQAGTKHRILIMGYVRPEIIAGGGLSDIDTAIVDLEQLRELAKIAGQSIRIHIKVDTGMHRQGILPGELSEAARIVAGNPMLAVVGICSHFADADTAGSAHTDAQLAVWLHVVEEARKRFPGIEYRHLAATAGMAHAGGAGGNVARLGRGLYGFDIAPGSALPLRPVLELRSIIVSLRSIGKGDAVGYNATHRAARASRVATVPMGYFEGVSRGLSNTGVMLVRGHAAPILGRVSMNMTSIDVSDIPNVARGDMVVAISRRPSDPNSLTHISQASSAYPNDILVHIPAHLRRVIE
ncbi:MAG: alanine racemase [bacterium]|nr:alanine racemase [bacterium]